MNKIMKLLFAFILIIAFIPIIVKAVSSTFNPTALYSLGQPDLTSTTGGNAASSTSVSWWMGGIAGDTERKLLYVAEGGVDAGNQRVLVFDTSDGVTTGEAAIYVIGQSTFDAVGVVDASPTNTNFYGPAGIALDLEGQRLFVADKYNHRVMIFDVNTIANGEPAIHVLGQPDFSTTNASTSVTGLNSPFDLKYDSATQLLYVADYSNNRVVVYDVATIVDGEPAVHVLGQPDFTVNTFGTNAAGLRNPTGVTIDSSGQRLFVSDWSNHRVLVYDVATIIDGEDAVNVLGQPDLVTVGGTISVANITKTNRPMNLDYDSASKRLFVSELNSHVVSVFDVSSITNGEDKIALFGKSSFTDGGVGLFNNNTGVYYDSRLGYLFATSNFLPRVLVFDASLETSSQGYSTIYETIGNITYATRGSVTTVYSINTINDLWYQSYLKSNGLATVTVSTSTTKSISNDSSASSTSTSQVDVNVNNIAGATSSFMFKKNLSLKSSDIDVIELQKYLNKKGFLISTSGIGSPGQETSYFGPLTQKALINFQKSKNILPTLGYFGPKTRTLINSGI